MPAAPAHRRPTPLDPTGAAGYQVGLRTAGLLEKLFPAEYAAHIRARPATPAQLAIAAQVFLTLVHTRCFPIYETTLEIDYCADLQAALTLDPRISDPLFALVEVDGALTQPDPVLYGLPLQETFDCGEPEYISALTVAIWALFRGSALSLAVDIQEFLAHLAPAAQAAIARLTPIPPWTPIAPLLQRVAMRNRPWSAHVGELLAYAFNETANPLARVTRYDMGVVYGGMHDFTWDDAARIAAWSAEAQQLVDAYMGWEEAVECDPTREIRRLSAAVHRAARPLAEAARRAEPSVAASNRLLINQLIAAGLDTDEDLDAYADALEAL